MLLQTVWEVNSQSRCSLSLPLTSHLVLTGRRLFSYVNETDFVTAIAPEQDFAHITRQQYGALFKVADRRKVGKVSWDDYIAFQGLLKQPAAEFDVSQFFAFLHS